MPPVKRKQWNPEAMLQAVNTVRKKEMGYQKAAKHFGVPKGTLERYVKDQRDPAHLIQVRLGRRPALPDVLEEELRKYCIEMDQRFYGLRLRDIKYMAFQMAIKNHLKHPFSVEKMVAGRKWLKSFLKRNPSLSVRSPQAVSAARIKGFTRENVNQFFDIFEPEMGQIRFSPHRLYNVDETGITVVQHKHSKVLSVKGKKQVGILTSMERGKLMTVVTCMNAAGNYVPPLIIFPRKNMTEGLMDGAPPGAISACHPSGWIQSHLFTRWLIHFIEFTKPSKDDPVLLVLDGHYSHTRNIDVIELARTHNVSIVCFPPHSTHKMQPMDVGFMSPLKTYYAQAIETWLRNNPGRTLPNNNVCKLLGEAYNKAATMETSVNAFRKSGLFPCNRHVFQDVDFSIHSEVDENIPPNISPIQTQPSAIQQVFPEPVPTQQPLTQSSTIQRASSVNRDKTPEHTDLTDNLLNNPVPGCSRDSPTRKRLKANIVSPFQFSPVPKICKNNSHKIQKRTGSTNLITSSPYKTQIIEANEKKIQKEKVFAEKKKARIEKTKVKINKKKIQTKKKFESSSSEDEKEIPLEEESDDDDEDNDAICMYCSGKFSEDTRGEKWAQCSVCFKWSHEDCGNLTSDVFICVQCYDSF